MRILVGIMYCIENELDACIAAIQRQTYQKYDYFVVDNLPNKEAHDKLYQTFMNASDEYQLFVKIDADMVLCRNTYFAEVVQEFSADPELTLLQVAVYDFFTDQLIFGQHNYRSTVRWNTNEQELFTDKQSISEKIVNDSNTLAPAAVHCPDPSHFQAFHFGVHKAVKVMQIGIVHKSLKGRSVHWDNILRMRAHFDKNRDKRLGYAVLGAAIAFKHKFTYQQVDYVNPLLNQHFSAVESLSLTSIIQAIHENTVFRKYPSVLRLILVSLFSEHNSIFQVPWTTYYTVIKSVIRTLTEDKKAVR